LLFLAYVWGFIGIPTAFIVDLLLFDVGVRACVRACQCVCIFLFPCKNNGKEKYIHDFDGGNLRKETTYGSWALLEGNIKIGFNEAGS